MSLNESLLIRAREYARRHDFLIGNELGHWVHGIVFATESQPEKGAPATASAIKVHAREPDYRRERDVYLRLKEEAITTIRDCNVPQLLRFDDSLWVIEMSVVSRPFVLDFAGAFLDEKPDVPEDVMADWRAEKLDQFGVRWPKVESILRILESYGIYLVDVSPSNVAVE